MLRLQAWSRWGSRVAILDFLGSLARDAKVGCMHLHLMGQGNVENEVMCIST
jgi:hypothetical protein